jgi:uncharacterized protein YaaW (UPF0174 family)
MKSLLRTLHPADYKFLVEVIRSPVNLTDDRALQYLATQVEEHPADESVREELCEAIEKEFRYLGSSDFAFAFRSLSGREPGVSTSEVIRDVARTLKVSLQGAATEEEMLRTVVTGYATEQFALLSDAEKQEMLVEIGVDRVNAAAFVKKSAGVFAVPLMIQAFNALIVETLIKRIIFGAIAKIIGSQLSQALFLFLARRLPWWVGWIGPVAWTGSIGWTAIDLQGPATRKTVPIVLYLGLCVVRETGFDDEV